MNLHQTRIPPRDPDGSSLAAPVTPESAPSLRSALAERNPCFILSGLCMLGGCYLVNTAVHNRPDEVAPLVGMIVTVATYQALVAALAVWLAVTGRSPRDALILTLIVVWLGVDGTLLLGELITMSPTGGAMTAGCFLLLSVIELTWILRAHRIALARGACAAVVGNLTLCYTLPTIFRASTDDGFLPPTVLYAACWMVAGSLVGTAAGFRAAEPRRVPARDVTPYHHVLRVALGVVPLVSIALHLWIARFAYHAAFPPVNAAVLVLGASLALLMIGRSVLPIGLGLLGLILAIGLGSGDHGPGWAAPGTQVTPWRLTLLGVGGGLAAVATVRREWWFGLIAPLPTLVATLGPTPDAVAKLVQQSTTTTKDVGTSVAQRVVPDTLLEWGVTAAAFAFVLLLCGWWVATAGKRLAVPDDHPSGYTTD